MTIIRRIGEGVPAPVVDALEATSLPYDLDVSVEREDVVISIVGSRDAGWTFETISIVADALGIRDIDLRDVADRMEPDDSPIVYDGGGCSSCGYGDQLVVRGAAKVIYMDDNLNMKLLPGDRSMTLDDARALAEWTRRTKEGGDATE